MKKILNLSILAVSTLIAASSCTDWDEHYDEAGINTTEAVDVYNGDIVSYMNSASDVSKMAALYKQNGVFANMNADNTYTLFVCDDNTFANGTITDPKAFANYCVADIALPPSQLTEGFGVQTRLGKHIWVGAADNGIKLDDYNVKKTVKTNNGYIYYIDGVLPLRQSIYEFLKGLDDNEYSTFKKLVTSYDTLDFDREHSTIIGVSQDGSTLYDSVIVVKNTLMDRYDANGLATWNMRDEGYNSTMFVPTNAQIEKAINDACDSIPVWLNRESTTADTTKFKEWIVKACFVDRQLEPEALSGNKVFKCVGGNVEKIDVANDKVTYPAMAAAYWQPAIQKANTSDKQRLSNGNAYFLSNFKIPNHIVVHRFKSEFYKYWNASLDKDYFTWRNWTTPQICNDAQGSFYGNTTNMGTWPDIYYNVLTAVPTDAASEDELTCSVEYTGIVTDEDGDYYECHVPAGEYYLRMGFVHSLTYTVSIYFQDSEDIEFNRYQTAKTNIVMSTQASNYHFDRGGASDIQNYGDNLAIGYPEGYNPADWLEMNENAYLYDTDGWNVGTVKVKRNGIFRIKVESYDAARIWKANGNTGRDKNNKNQLMMYHWCLRPTPNNY